MWAPASPITDPISSSCPSLAASSSTTIISTVQADSLQAPVAPRDGLQTPSSLPSSLDSLSVQPIHLQATSSLGSLPESSSIQSDSLESFAGQQESPVSFLQDSLNPWDGRDSLQLYPANFRSIFSLGDSLETSSIQLDSLQSVASLGDNTQASSILTDSLESPCSLCDSLETPNAVHHCSGSYSV
ncbi:hypothetical protein E2320_009566 [Naja naja]|nr:hypothetical protein E2320_009566 [Naja naja]